MEKLDIYVNDKVLCLSSFLMEMHFRLDKDDLKNYLIVDDNDTINLFTLRIFNAHESEPKPQTIIFI